MIKLKSSAEIQIIKEASRILKLTMNLLEKMLKPGITTIELDKAAEKFIIQNGAKPSFKGYQGFPASICASVNEQVVHGIPDNTKLKEGDIITIDIGVYKDGFHSDAARTFGVGKISKEDQDLIRAAKDAFFEGIRDIRAGSNTIGDISFRIQRYIESKGYGIIRELVGHGIGEQLHEDPSIPNFGNPKTGPEIMQGLVIAVEPMISHGNGEVVFKEDGWTCITADNTRAAHYENTIAFIDNKIEILTDECDYE